MLEPQKRSWTVFSKAVSQPSWAGQSVLEKKREALTTLSSNVNPLAGVIAQNLSCTHSVTHINSISTRGIRILIKALTLYHVNKHSRLYSKRENRRSSPSQRPCRNASAYLSRSQSLPSYSPSHPTIGILNHRLHNGILGISHLSQIERHSSLRFQRPL